MSNVKVGDWVVNTGDTQDPKLTIGKRYKVKEVWKDYICVIDGDDENELLDGDYKPAPQKYRNPPREEYRELLDAWLAGADLQMKLGEKWVDMCMLLDSYNYRVNPDSILPQPDERKERIKKQLLKIDADKLAQLIIDAGIEL